MKKLGKKPIHKYGCSPDRIDQRDFMKAMKLHPMQLPAFVDLTSKMSPIRNQGNLGACTGFGCTAALERWDQNIFSPLFLYYYERVRENLVDQDSGATIRDGLKVLHKIGCCLEKEWPYIENKFKVKPPDSLNESAEKYIISSFSRVIGINNIKEQIFMGDPIIIGISVYESFESDETAKTGIVPMPEPKEALLGGHCMLIAGYQDLPNGINYPGNGYFIVKNSWSEEWGLKGYCRIPYLYIQKYLSDAWVLETEKKQ